MLYCIALSLSLSHTHTHMYISWNLSHGGQRFYQAAHSLRRKENFLRFAFHLIKTWIYVNILINSHDSYKQQQQQQ